MFCNPFISPVDWGSVFKQLATMHTLTYCNGWTKDMYVAYGKIGLTIQLKKYFVWLY